MDWILLAGVQRVLWVGRGVHRQASTLDVACRGPQTMVHYWYQPDSYDRCIPASVAPEAIEVDKRIRGARLRQPPPEICQLPFALAGVDQQPL